MARKKIAIDVREALVEKPAGKGLVVRFLVEALLKENPPLQLVLFCSANQKAPRHWPIRRIPACPLSWHLYLALFLLPFSDIDLFISPLSAITPALLWGKKSLLVVTDLSAWRYPKEHKLKTFILDRFFLPLAVKRAGGIIAISSFTKKELGKVLGVKKNKVRVMPLAPTFAGERKIRLPFRDYFLYLGTLEPRKNIGRMIRAYSLASREKTLPPLLLAGRLGWKTKAIEQLIAQSPAVHYLGYLPDDQKKSLLRGAYGFLFPSLYEGFGLPVLEALSLGVPTLVSRAGSLPEVAGEAACYVNPHNTSDIKKGILKLTNPALRASLKRKGPPRAAQFSWSQSARVLIETINEIARQR